MENESKDVLMLGVDLTLWAAVIAFIVYCALLGKGALSNFTASREYRASTFSEGQTYERGIVAYGDVLDILELHYGSVEIEVVRKSVINGASAEYVYNYGLSGNYFTVTVMAGGATQGQKRIAWRDGTFFEVNADGYVAAKMTDALVMTYLGLSYVPCEDLRGGNFTANEFTQEMYVWAREYQFACSAVKDPQTGIVTKISLVQVGG